ncbi:beta-N-acetylhexosaminidase [Paenibacillus glucanolyticus]|jgi:beta-N-acetylhexosaminidase|uniref:beta-N-acetylhexosaminidase n=1 Tax=Paenibacillus TaxID=44249 RepID=UPI0003E1BAFF|nr:MULTISPECIES: beta-N-acetylhexosaminidase [Paenibacillus]ANA81919.1 glycoside hydrolase [Paenibacillus glucanolyticus]AVV59348.1 beta-N-acetylhexosaminidase [Paenibacillus glucanolyticus]ETT43345.1 glycoside hydrolase family protein [Paenibacillus sp. FSL R5-808]MPY16125.1 beta-N-acetylhexosaminidase [Paenibacillus glucanolyticus]
MKWTIADLSLEQKVGQMFICGFNALTPNEHANILIDQYQVGGICYFRRNVRTLPQLAELSESLQQLASGSQKLPLLLSIDQEGGMVARIDHEGISRIPGNMALGAAGSAEDSYRVAQIGARELRSLGVNMNFAPCLDVNNNPRNPVIGVRSFSEDPQAVAALGTAAIKGYQEEGVSATAKHFPGHGDTSVDSHLGRASVPHDMERLRRVELYPFAQAIKAGVDAIMTAHVSFPAIESSDLPATLSHAVLTGLLREEMGFEGLIVTDCLEMHAISKEYGIPEGAIRAIEAGADCVLVSHTLSEQTAAITAVIEAVQSGRLSMNLIDRSVERILALKERNAKLAEELPVQSIGEVTEETKQLLAQIAGRGITLVKDEGQLPLQAEQAIAVIWPELLQATQVDEAWSKSYTLGDALRSYGVQADDLRVGTDMSDAEVEQAVKAAEGYRQIVVATYTSESSLPAGQQKLVNKLAELEGVSIVVVATRNPYDMNDLPPVATYLCSYENTPYYMNAAAGVLLGKVIPEGKLPVSISDTYPLGWSGHQDYVNN